MDTLTRILRRPRPLVSFRETRRFIRQLPVVSARRDFNLITNRHFKSAYPLYRLFLPKLQQYEDRRRWHPEGANALPRSMVQFKTRLQERPPNFQDNEIYNPRTGELIYTTGSQLNQTSFKPWKIAFDNPWKTIICIKRKMRKEIIHALGLGGQA